MHSDTTGTVKVYELAKELGMDSMSLLDKLKALRLPVKSHMSEISRQEVQGVLSSLKKREAGEAKKLTGAAAASVAAAAAKAVAVKKKASAAEAGGVGSVGESKRGIVSGPVVRRRVAGGAIVSQPVAKEAPLSEGGSSGEVPLEGEEVSSRGEGLAIGEGSEALSSLATEELEGVGGTSGVVKAVEEAEADVLGELTESVSSTLEAPPVEVPVKKRPPVILPPRPVAPKRSILKIVEAAAPPSRPIEKPPVTNVAVSQNASLKNTTSVSRDPEGFRIIKMTKENLDQMVEEEAARKRGGPREVEIRPEDVRFADYRKKELVFLPKKKKIPLGKEIKKTVITKAKAQKRVIEVEGALTVQDFAARLHVKAGELLKKLIQMGESVTLQSVLDFDTLSLLAADYQYEVRNAAFDETKILGVLGGVESPEVLKTRPPVITVMGHVDHGKTTLLDAFRETQVVSQEAGGITQHIGASTIQKNGKFLTFIDTPGHEAFTLMRARGAQITDVVILVVSADDGVMPQTREALSHAQAARVPIVVAVNKMDKPDANPDRVKKELAELNLLPEEWGGETPFIPVSALKRTGLEDLLEAVLLQAEMLDLKANPEASQAHGTVLEARLEKGRGPVVSLLVRKGTLRLGDAWVAGSYAGKVRALTGASGEALKEVLPGFAAEVLGLEGVPQAGESFQTVASESEAREVVEHRAEKVRQQAQAASAPNRMRLEDLFSQVQTGQLKELSVILKADTFGSVEALRESLEKLSTPKVKVKLLLAAVGGILESDVLLAKASQAIILGFHVRPETKARQLAEREKIEVRCYTIIYQLLEEVKAAMAGLLDKKKVEVFLGRAEVRQIFSIPKQGVIAGCSVIDGKVTRQAKVRLLRQNRVVFEGALSSLRRFKDDVKEVATGFECGMSIENYQDLKLQDVIEAYEIQWVAQEL